MRVRCPSCGRIIEFKDMADFYTHLKNCGR